MTQNQGLGGRAPHSPRLHPSPPLHPPGLWAEDLSLLSWVGCLPDHPKLFTDKWLLSGPSSKLLWAPWVAAASQPWLSSPTTPRRPSSRPVSAARGQSTSPCTVTLLSCWTKRSNDSLIWTQTAWFESQLFNKANRYKQAQCIAQRWNLLMFASISPQSGI